jgi:hypothetical protein
MISDTYIEEYPTRQIKRETKFDKTQGIGFMYYKNKVSNL